MELRQSVASKTASVNQLHQQVLQLRKGQDDIKQLQDEIDVLRPKAAALDKAEVGTDDGSWPYGDRWSCCALPRLQSLPLLLAFVVAMCATGVKRPVRQAGVCHG